MPLRSPVNLRAAVALVAAALALSACGSDGPASVDPVAAEAAARNEADLRTSDDVRRIEVLEITTGSATTLADVADGERPVLVWFWAPH